MSLIAATEPYRPAGTAGVLIGRGLAVMPALMAALRRVAPLGFGPLNIATRYDDVLEVFATDAAFGVPYHANLAVITGGAPFFLGMGDTPEYRTQIAAARAVTPPADLARLGDDAERRATALVAASGGRVEVVSFVRRLAFDLIAGYFGIPEPAVGSLAVWGSRLFEFQFTGSPDDKAWLAEVEQFGAAFHAHIDATIAARKASPAGAPDDVLGRCLAAQAAGKPGYDDAAIRTLILCMIVGGPPQPPMVVPQGIDQLLRRPDWLAAAGDAARANDDARLHDILIEAMRFDPLAPWMTRTVLADHIVAAGTPRARTIRAGKKMLVAFPSAMMDPRRVPDPQAFNPARMARDYVHFGHGLHSCFGEHINHATLHRMVKPLLARPNLARAAGDEGRLRKIGGFADRLVVTFA